MTSKPLIINSPVSSSALLMPSDTSKPVAPSSIIPMALDRISQQEPKDLPPIPIQTSLTLTDVLGKTLAEKIKENPGLTTLHLIDCNLLTHSDLQELAKLPKLTHLTLKGCTRIFLSKQSIDCLSQLKSLRHLTLKGARVTDAVVHSAARLSSLRGLDLSDCENVTDEGVKELTAEKLPLLEYLNLNECPISDRGMETIVKHVSLKELHLKHCHITDKSMEKISTLPSLQRLSVYGCWRITDTGIGYIAKQESLKEIVLNRCNELTLKGLEQLKKPPFKIYLDMTFFCDALNKKDIPLLSFLFENKIRPQKENEDGCIQYESLLYNAVDKNNIECVTLLLEYGGFDPDQIILDDGITTTPLQKALATGNFGLIALLLAYRKDKQKPLPDIPSSPPKKYLKEDEFEKLIARGLGSLSPSPDKIRLFSSYVISEVRKEAPSILSYRLLQASPNMQRVINPLINFVAKETLSNPQFAVYIVPQRHSECLGEYDSSTGDIFLYVPRDALIIDRSDNEILFMLNVVQKTTLLHEIIHKVVDKLLWNSKARESQMKEFATAVEGDITALKDDHWMECDPVFKTRFDCVSQFYPKNQQFEEYLVRTVQVISDIAHSDSSLSQEELEMPLMDAIPNLYRIFKEHLLPELEVYNRT